MSEPETIEGEFEDVTEERHLPAVQKPLTPAVGIFELGAMDDDEYTRNVAVIKTGINRVRDLMRDLLEPGTDVMDFSGDAGKRDATKQRKGLLKPGSEKLATFFHLVPEFKTSVTTTPFDGRPDRIDVIVEALAHYGSIDGPVVGAGTGAASSWEVKYHYRSASLACPTCGKELRMSKKDREWYCWAKVGGCGATFAVNDERITGQQTGQTENPDPHELLNTLVKMGTKRAWTDTVIRALNASALFTQDAEDMPAQRASDGGGYGGDEWGEMNDPRAVPQSARSASGTAQDRSNAPETSTGHAKGDEWAQGGPDKFPLKVAELPGGMRHTTDGLPILEVATKRGNSKHLVMLEGPMAQWAGLLIDQTGIDLTVEGQLYQYMWDEQKPTQKRIRDVTRLGIRTPTEDGTGTVWQVFPAGGASASPPPSPDSSTATTTASPTPTSSGTDPKEVADPQATSTGTGEPDTASSTGATASTGDLTAVAAGMFDMEVPLRATGTKGEPVKVTGNITAQYVTATPNGDEMIAMKIIDAGGYEFHLALSKAAFGLVQLDGAFKYDEGTNVTVRGAWNGSGKVVVVTGLMLA